MRYPKHIFPLALLLFSMLPQRVLAGDTPDSSGYYWHICNYCSSFENSASSGISASQGTVNVIVADLAESKISAYEVRVMLESSTLLTPQSTVKGNATSGVEKEIFTTPIPVPTPESSAFSAYESALETYYQLSVGVNSGTVHTYSYGAYTGLSDPSVFEAPSAQTGIELPPVVNGVAINSVADILTNSVADYAVGSYVNLLLMQSTLQSIAGASATISALIKLLEKEPIDVTVIFPDGSSIKYRLVNPTSSIPMEKLTDTARDKNGNVITSSGQNTGSPGSGESTVSSGAGGASSSTNFQLKCVSGYVNGSYDKTICFMIRVF